MKDLIEEIIFFDIVISDISVIRKRKLERNCDLQFEEKSFFIRLLGCNPNWDCKIKNTYTSDKIVKLFSFVKFVLISDCMEGSFVYSFWQSISINFMKPWDKKFFVDRKR